MGFLDRLRPKKKKEPEGPRPWSQLPPELLHALMSVPPQVAQRLMSIRSQQQLMELLAEHPASRLVIEQIMVQTPRREHAALMKAIDTPDVELCD
jgi:hypothetical protein